MTEEDLMKLVLESFKAQKENNIGKNKVLLHKDFKVTEMNIGSNGTIFPSLSGQDVQSAIERDFKIRNLEFIFKNVIADVKKGVVIVEFIESFPDPKTGKVYRIPQIAVCEIKEGKIFRTRHYNDPRIPYKYLDPETIDKTFE